MLISSCDGETCTYVPPGYATDNGYNVYHKSPTLQTDTQTDNLRASSLGKTKAALVTANWN